MDRHEQDRRVSVERVLSSISVVDIPIQDHHPLDALAALCVASRDHDIVEDAVAHAFVAQGMVAGRAHIRENALDPAGHDRIDRGHHPARGEQCDLIRVDAGPRTRSGFTAAGLADLLDPRDVFPCVIQGDVVNRRFIGANPVELFPESCKIDQVLGAHRESKV